eukprot:14654049-Alexandrium_andersonii.AAC.1
MSASLVGSEMCIRDRFLAWPTSSGEGRSQRLMRRSTDLSRKDVEWDWVCLLYTSDAADDM